MSLQYAVLGLLSENPHYGYEIKQEFENSIGDIWPISYGQLYPTLKMLTERGFVTRKKESGKKAIDKNVYFITDEGRKHLQKWINDYPKKIQLSIKDEFTLLFFFYEKIGTAKLLTMMKEQYKSLDYQSNKYKHLLLSLRGNKRQFPKAIIRKMLLHLEAEKQWLQELSEEYSHQLQRQSL
ncbi:MAG: PadR family transcriptional regulator [Spirochaetota bacterium]